MLQTIGYRKFLLAIVAMASGLLFVVFYTGSTASSYDNSFNAGDGFDSIGRLFGGLGSMAAALGVLVVLSLALFGIYKLSKTGKHGFVPLAFLAFGVLCAIVGLKWIHLSWGMLAPLFALAFVTALTWTVARIAHKK